MEYFKPFQTKMEFFSEMDAAEMATDLCRLALPGLICSIVFFCAFRDAGSGMTLGKPVGNVHIPHRLLIHWHTCHEDTTPRSEYIAALNKTLNCGHILDENNIALQDRLFKNISRVFAKYSKSTGGDKRKRIYDGECNMVICAEEIISTRDKMESLTMQLDTAKKLNEAKEQELKILYESRCMN
ncbi:uncharacterized protein LOC135807856 [Sycon ciliatum]|uniref:uncharacterized protein LOC135807856 n=1 Tax=Sycon ciliatum TaxID=27933 RepID=UPI0031F7092A